MIYAWKENWLDLKLFYVNLGSLCFLRQLLRVRCRPWHGHFGTYGFSKYCVVRMTVSDEKVHEDRIRKLHLGQRNQLVIKSQSFSVTGDTRLDSVLLEAIVSGIFLMIIHVNKWCLLGIMLKSCT